MTSEGIATQADKLAEQICHMTFDNCGGYEYDRAKVAALLEAALASVAQERDQLLSKLEYMEPKKFAHREAAPLRAECERLRAELAQARADERRKTLEEVEAAIEPAPWLYTTSYSACDAVKREIRRLRDLPPVSESDGRPQPSEGSEQG